MLFLDLLHDLVERIDVEVVDLWVFASVIGDGILNLLLIRLQILDVVNKELLGLFLDINLTGCVLIQLFGSIVSFLGVLIERFVELIVLGQNFDVVNQDLSLGFFLLVVQRIVDLNILLDLFLTFGKVHLRNLRLDFISKLSLGHLVRELFGFISTDNKFPGLKRVLRFANGELGSNSSTSLNLLGIDQVVIEVSPSWERLLGVRWEVSNLNRDALGSLTEVFMSGAVVGEGRAFNIMNFWYFSGSGSSLSTS